MNNQDIARILFDIADFLEAQDVPFKPRAYHQAAEYIERTSEDLVKLYKKRGVDALEALPAVGQNIAKKIGELVDTGKLKYLEKLQHALPVEMGELVAIEGVGPKTVRRLYDHCKVRTLADLKRACQSHAIQRIRGFREKTEQKIEEGIELLQRSQERRPLRAIVPVAQRIERALLDTPGVSRVAAAGSIRRREATVGDIDIVAASTQPQKVIDKFVSLPEVIHIYGKGETKALVRLTHGIDADLRVVDPKSYGAALQYFTGNKAHSIATRKLAQAKGMKLNEYGLFKRKRQIAGKSEKEIYHKLGLPYIKPERRTGVLPRSKS